VTSQYKDLYKIVTEGGECFAEVSGKFRFEAVRLSDYPAVGDFVMADRVEDSAGHAVIHRVLPRRSAFERAAVGVENQTQVIAANIDTVFVCMSLNYDYNLSRLERYLSVAWNSRATPVVVLTKATCAPICPRVLPKSLRLPPALRSSQPQASTRLAATGCCPSCARGRRRPSSGLRAWGNPR
jgi:ribosome biogenesis GTPase